MYNDSGACLISKVLGSTCIDCVVDTKPCTAACNVADKLGVWFTAINKHAIYGSTRNILVISNFQSRQFLW